MPGSARERLIADLKEHYRFQARDLTSVRNRVGAIEREAVAAERARIKSRAEAYWAADFITEEEWDRVYRFIGEEPL